MIYEIRPMSFGEVLDMGFRILRNHFVPLVGIAAVMYVPISVITDWFSQDPTAAVALGTLIVGGLAAVAVSPIVFAAIIFAIGEAYLGRPVEFAKSFRSVMPIIVPLMGTTVLAAVFVGLAVILLIVPALYLRFSYFAYPLLLIPGIYLQLSYIVAWQVMVMEHIFGRRALERSRHLMRGNLWRGFGVLFVGGLIVAVTGQVLQFLLGFVPFLGPVASGLAQAAGSAYASAIAVVFYFDIRCRKEAFDLEHLAHLVETKLAPDALVTSPS